jgi:hypothetical protein
MSTGNLLRVEERMCLAVRQTGRQFGMDRTTLTTFSEEPTMPYLRLDLAKTYPPETKRELAERLYLNLRSDADSLRRGVHMSQQIADDLDVLAAAQSSSPEEAPAWAFPPPAWLSIVPAASCLWAVPWAG